MLRIITSFNFLVLVGLFFLPWIEIRCEMAGQGGMNILHQTGIQAASGKFTDGELLQMEKADQRKKERAEKAAAKKKKDDGDEDKEKDPDANPKKDKGLAEMFGANENPPGAMLLWAYLAVLCCGIVLSLVLPKGVRWRGGVLICAIAAMTILGLQTIIGFPIESKVQEKFQEYEEDKADGDDGIMAKKLTHPLIKSRYLLPFYLTWLLSATLLFCAFMDTVLQPKNRKYQPPSRGDSDEDDDDRIDNDNPFA